MHIYFICHKTSAYRCELFIVGRYSISASNNKWLIFFTDNSTCQYPALTCVACRGLKCAPSLDLDWSSMSWVSNWSSIWAVQMWAHMQPTWLVAQATFRTLRSRSNVWDSNIGTSSVSSEFQSLCNIVVVDPDAYKAKMKSGQTKHMLGPLLLPMITQTQIPCFQPILIRGPVGKVCWAVYVLDCIFCMDSSEVVFPLSQCSKIGFWLGCADQKRISLDDKKEGK